MMTTLLGCGTSNLEEKKETSEITELNVAYMPNYGSLWSVLNAIEQGYMEEVDGTTKLADNMSFSDEMVSLSSWVSGPNYAEENKEVLIRFTRALFKAMDYGATQNQKETAALIAKQISVDENMVYEQSGDAQWLSGREVAQGAAEGVVEAYYELQKRAFVEAPEL